MGMRKDAASYRLCPDPARGIALDWLQMQGAAMKKGPEGP